MKTPALFRPNQPAFRQQYAALRERSLTARSLLPGTPGTLQLRRGTGYAYWYRVYYPVPGKQAETLVGREGDSAAENAMRAQMDFAESTARQVGMLRKLGFHVADKISARALVELHNLGAFEGGLLLAGSLGCMAWLNELGARLRQPAGEPAVLPRLELVAPAAFLSQPLAAALPLVAAPEPSAVPNGAAPTELATHATVALPGLPAIPADILVAGPRFGAAVSAPGLAWSATTTADHAYLLADPAPGALLAGGQCIPVHLPQAARLVWHQLYVSRHHTAAQAMVERRLALSLAAVVLASDPWAMLTAWEAAPSAIIEPLRPLREALLSSAAGHPDLQDLLADCLGAPPA
ncbi:MAG: hypothetical protein KKE51_02420 [Gammaproteobacteria bacterium]|nr:hypothetical protein [Gammaproteobacteria bacterium]MBU1600848.1 hypothetical protein [Gammaproteobacteria bacterium]MBU2435304.1 hypothetical protein [Gammaproteobacteria bacterium]MBU2448718.1 hypothetical protein [Gammaproteobacteria bacterium]